MIKIAQSHLYISQPSGRQGSTPLRLLLVRHGSTVYNEEGRYTGQRDIPLSVPGERQAVLSGERLATEPIDVIVSSDLQRTRVTAQAIAQHHNLPILEDASLREVSLGAWEGVTYAEIKARYADGLALWRADSAHTAPHGGETIIQVRDRVVPALQRWQAHYPDATMLWVTHGGVIGMLLCHLLGLDLNRRLHFRCFNASITTIDLNHEGAFLVHSNEVTHLRSLT
jgi:alpha-ribazole phosphatase